MPSSFDVEIGVDEEGHFEALSKQPMDFQDAIGEIIDNGISANITNDDYFKQDGSDDSPPEEDFQVQVSITRYDDRVEVIVADDGCGMERGNAESHNFKSGDTENSTGILNEHGMGMLNALCVLTKNDEEESFTIYSSPEGGYDDGEHIRIEGPFGPDMGGEVGDFSGDGWTEGAEKLDDRNKGTRIHVTTTNEFLQSCYPGNINRLDTISDVLHEHFGVMYRKFLEKTENNKIYIDWDDRVTDDRGEISVEPMFPVYREGEDTDGNDFERSEQFEIEDENGDSLEVEYRWGVVDWDETLEEYQKDNYDGFALDSSSPFRVYYKNNTQTQGVDIIKNGRLLNTSVIQNIWDLEPNDRFNSFVGEIHLKNGGFETVNNKVEINKSTTAWENLVDKLNEDEWYEPIPWGSQEKEDTTKDKIEADLEDRTPSDEVLREKGYQGVDVDILYRLESGDEYIYEVKRPGVEAEPKHVYQCVMYWDACKKTNDEELQKVVLVASGISGNAQSFLNDWNSREDEHGNTYSIEFKQISEILD